MRHLTYAQYSNLPQLIRNITFLTFSVIAIYLISIQVAYAYPGESCVKEDMSCQDACLRIPLTSPEFKPCTEKCTATANACIEREKAAAGGNRTEHAEPPSQ